MTSIRAMRRWLPRSSLALVTLLVACSSGTSLPNSRPITGTWSGEGLGITLTAKIVEQNGQISGTADFSFSAQKTGFPVRGTRSGQDVTFDLLLGSSVWTRYMGVIQSQTLIVGEDSIPGYQSFEMNLTKVGS